MILSTLLAMTLGTASAQTPAPRLAGLDAQWAAWLGCWQASTAGPGGERVCVTTREGGGVTLTTLVGLQQVNEETIVADATPRPIAEAECRGTEKAEWSHRGPRVFSHIDVTCGQDAPRAVSALLFLAPDGGWVDARLVDAAGATSVRVRRYRRAADQTLPNGQRAAARAPAAPVARWQAADVIEASAKLPAEVVQAALSELNAGFDVNAKTLIAMADAGVEPQVIDLMVALTFPRRFEVERAGYSGGGFAGMDDMWGGMGAMGGVYGMYDPFFSPYAYASSYLGAAAIGYPYWMMSPYGFGGYGSYGGYDPRYLGAGNGWVVINSGGGAAGDGQQAVEGRVVNGRGYTQVRVRAPEPVRVESAGGGVAGTSSTGGSSNTGSSGVSSQGYSGSGGSSGGDGGRTAVPRPPG